MSIAARIGCLATIAALGLAHHSGARADIVDSGGGFSSTGSVGYPNSNPTQSITYGADGQGLVYQMDGYVNVPGVTTGINGSTSADLDNGSPPGIATTFSASQPTKDQLLLSYHFLNNSGSALSNFQFLSFVDTDNGDNDSNSDGSAYTREYAKVNGAATLGLPGPTSYQVGDPGNSTIFTNIGNGTLNDRNDFPNSSTLGDVSAALGFNLGTLGVGQSATVNILLSDDGSSLGNFSITQVSPNDYPNDSLTVSGAVVPEPSSLVLLGIGSAAGLGALARRRGGVQAWTRSQ